MSQAAKGGGGGGEGGGGLGLFNFKWYYLINNMCRKILK